jgi:hypothetical protein
MTDVSRASLIAAGVNGRFQARGTAMAPELVPDTAPVLSNEESVAIPAINAGDETEPEEVA